MRNTLLLICVAGAVNGCSCSQNNPSHGLDLSAPEDGSVASPDLSMNPDAIAGGALDVEPSDVTLDVIVGMAPPTQFYTAKLRGSGMDVTNMAGWTVDDNTLGVFTASTFTANTTHGGTTMVHANWQGMSAYATLHVKLHATVSSDSCPGCPAFPPDTTPACTVAAQTPTILYPPNGALVPPNMNVMETQFDQGSGNALYEIDYENTVTDIRVETQCNPITDSKMNATNGCAYDLSQQVWDFLASTNRGGDPVNIIVRATDGSGSCIATSSSQVAISFGQDDLNGGLYYWQSIAVTGLMGATGGIFRYDFGVRGQLPQPFLAPQPSPMNMLRCIGCHFLSRDGVKMSYGNDDPDADDEYSDLDNYHIDVASKTTVQILQHAGGFQAFSPDHKLLLATDGSGGTNNQGMGMSAVKADPNSFFLFDGNTGAFATPSLVSTGTGRPTQPDWSPDGSSIVFVKPASFTVGTYGHTDDNHFTGGSLYTMSYTGGSFGTPAPLLMSQGENNYYPAFSPDGQFVVFNQVPLSGTRDACTGSSCPNDAFSNPRARVSLMPAAGGAAVDLAAMNSTGDLSNSWPRFAPNVQMYKGHQIAWVTFSSTRDYGDVVRNTAMVGGMPQHICYPPESPENTSGNKNVTSDPSCNQPQLWMAAIDLTAAAAGTDSSFPAFWLPFQLPSAHNHIAQWVTTLVNLGPPDAGAPDGGDSCIPGIGACTPAVGGCCNGICCSDTHTCGCIP